MLCSWEGNCRPGWWLIVTCGPTACTPGWAMGPTFVKSMGSLYLLLSLCPRNPALFFGVTFNDACSTFHKLYALHTTMLQHRQHLQELRRQEANSKCQAYLIDGADMTAMSKSRPMHRGWLGPTTKICLRKKELSSTSWTTHEHPSFPTLEQTSILQTTKTCSWTLRRCKSTGKKRQLLHVTHNVSPLGLASLWLTLLTN